MRRRQHHAPRLEHPGVAPPQGLGLAPGAVEQHRPLDGRQRACLVEQGNALGVERDHLTSLGQGLGSRRAEMQDRPAFRIGRPAQRLGQARPRQADAKGGVGEVQRGQPRAAQRLVLLLRVLKDQ